MSSNNGNVTDLRPRQKGGDQADPDDLREGPLDPPKKLTKGEQWVWDTYINPATHLHADSSIKAYQYVVLAAELLRQKTKMTVTKQNLMRCLGNELGIGHLQKGAVKRAKPSKTDPADQYF